MMDNNERTVRELNALIETHLDSVEWLNDTVEALQSQDLKQVARDIRSDHQNEAQRLQERVRRLGGEPATDPHATNKLKESWQAIWEPGDDTSALLAMRANERVSVDGFKVNLLKENVVQTMTDEGLREHKDALGMELDHFQRETELLRQRGVAVDNDEVMGAVRNAAEHIHAAINLSGTAAEAFIKYVTGTANR